MRSEMITKFEKLSSLSSFNKNNIVLSGWDVSVDSILDLNVVSGCCKLMVSLLSKREIEKKFLNQFKSIIMQSNTITTKRVQKHFDDLQKIVSNKNDNSIRSVLYCLH